MHDVTEAIIIGTERSLISKGILICHSHKATIDLPGTSSQRRQKHLLQADIFTITRGVCRGKGGGAMLLPEPTLPKPHLSQQNQQTERGGPQTMDLPFH